MTTGALGTEIVERFGLYIGGRITDARQGKRFDTVDPTLGEAWASAADADATDVDEAVRDAETAFWDKPWRSLSASRRGRLLMRLGDAIGDHAERIARLETKDNGKLYREMVTQLRIVPDWLYYFGGAADKIQGDTIPVDRLSVLNYTLREPLGVVGIITPWNSPVFLSMMAAGPALAAGNTVVVKPSEVTPASMLEVARLATSVGFPDGALNVVTGQREAGEALVNHPGIAKIAVTGGTATGQAIAVQAARRLARVTLELGGKSANIIFADADLAAAEAGVIAGIYAAAGQTCVAGSRVLVQDEIYDEFVDRLIERAGSVRIGDPMDHDVQMGPLATAQQLAKVEAFVEDAVADGAEILAGGARPIIPGFPSGFFYEPTIVGRATPDSRIAQEEVFGPVLGVYRFRDDMEAIALANGTPYGLAAGVWTSNLKRAHRTAQHLQAGTVWINMYRALAPQSPFGGYKLSGIGRQNGIEALNEYLQTKSVWCELSDEVQDPFVIRA